MGRAEIAEAGARLGLDVVIPTFQRARLLEKAISSLLVARRPSAIDLRIYAADNNSKDDTEQVIRAFGEPVVYVHAPIQGRSGALNAGIAAGHGPLVAMIDDDEEVCDSWLEAICTHMTPDVDFLGGPYLPHADLQLPEWFPPDYSGILPLVPAGDRIREFGVDYNGMLMGGNAVIRRALLVQAGGYNAALGRSATRLLSCEDDEMYRRLLEIGARGLFVPEMAVYHFIPVTRLTKSYCRRWCFWHGVSESCLPYKTEGIACWFGIPRWMFGRCIRSVPRLLRRDEPNRAFAAQLHWFDLAGWACGRLTNQGQRASRTTGHAA
jgi:glycosyltransferase involved in cell wall biosynthesis